jgi:hypothetical protein
MRPLSSLRRAASVWREGGGPGGPAARVAGRGERGDLLAGRGIVGEHDHRAGAGHPAQQRRVGPRVRVVAGDHQAGRVGHAPAYLGEPPVRGVEHPGDRFPFRVQRSPPRLRQLVGGHRSAQGAGELVASPGPPAHLARVGQEDHRADHAVSEGPARTRRHSRPSCAGCRRGPGRRSRAGSGWRRCERASRSAPICAGPARRTPGPPRPRRARRPRDGSHRRSPAWAGSASAADAAPGGRPPARRSPPPRRSRRTPVPARCDSRSPCRSRPRARPAPTGA